MNKQEFIKLRIPFNKHNSGGISLNTIDSLPSNTKLVQNISEFIGYTGRITPNIVYFSKNTEGKYYIELTTERTNEKELIKYINLKLIHT